MSALYATGKLLWRPVSWLSLFALTLVSLAASWDLAGGPVDLIGAALYGDSSRDLRLAFWRLATLLPTAAGLLLSFSLRELQHTALAWTLPDLASRLRGGKLVVGIVLATLLATLAARMQGVSMAPAGFGWAFVCFALGGVAFDPVLSKLESKGVAVVLALLVFRPIYVEQLITVQPVVIGALLTATGLALLQREFSQSLSRARPVTLWVSGWSPPSPLQARQFWARHGPRSGEWTTDLSTARPLNWIRAGHLENFGGLRWNMAGIVLRQLTIIVAFAYFAGGTHMVVFFPWLFLGMGGLQIFSSFLYPLSRSQRAELFFWASAVESLVAIVMGAAGLVVLFLIGHDFESGPDAYTALEVVSYDVFFFAFVPLIHWAKVRGPFGKSMSTTHGLRYFGHQMAFIALAMGSAAVFRTFVTSPSPLAWVAVAFLLLTTHAVYWLALQHHFSKRDLVARS